MEIGRWLYYVVVNCAFVCIVAKPFSLNDLIDAESQINAIGNTTVTPKVKEPKPTAERISLNKGIKPFDRKLKKFKEGTTFTPISKKISPLKYRKTFQIKSPLKPKRVKLSLGNRHKRKNQSVKREINGNAKLNQKYVPLLRSLSMLFDNILGSDSGESIEVTKSKRKRFKYYPEGDDDIACKCPSKSHPNANSEPPETTITISKALSAEASATSQTAAEATDFPTTGDVRSFRHNKNLPILLPRNTFSARRNNNGLGERSRAAYNGSVERDISRDYGNSEHDTERGQDKLSAESDEEYSNGNSRNYASGIGPGGRIRGRHLRYSAKAVYENDTASKNETKIFLDGTGRLVSKLKRKDKFEGGRDETKSAKLLPKPVRRLKKLRRFLSEDKVNNTAESVQSQEDNEESDVSVAHDNSGDQRLFDRDGSSASEDQKASSGYEAVTSTKLVPKPIRKLRGFVSEDNITDIAKSVQSEDDEDSNISVAHDSYGDQRHFERDASSASEDQKVSSGYEAVTSAKLLPKPIRRLRGFVSEDKVNDTAGSVHSVKDHEESDVSIAHNSSGDQRLFDRDDSSASEDQKVSSSYEAVMHQEPEVDTELDLTRPTKTKGPVVMIFDGYSVTRHKNGENKLAEKAIHYRS